MTLYHIKGRARVELMVVSEEIDTIDFEKDIEANNQHEAENIALTMATKEAENEYDKVVNSDATWRKVEATAIQRTDEDESRDTYRAMVASGAPRLPGF